jgi:hypothetical protein
MLQKYSPGSLRIDECYDKDMAYIIPVKTAEVENFVVQEAFT